MEHEIALPHGRWFFDDSQLIGQAGGFGEVFIGKSADGTQVAVKRLKIDATDAAHRELRIADELAEHKLTHVMPVLDSGQDANSDRYFIVMPLAAQSLQNRLDKSGCPSPNEIYDIMSQIIEGLIEVPDIVHRNLKPYNVLEHEGVWKVTDFGIVRFMEESTSLQKLRDCMTPDYAAPEQWEFVKATSAIDVYALGCIAHALATGRPPFFNAGLDIAELRDAHLWSEPPALPNVAPQFAAIVAMMLRKPPESRPTLERVRTVLADVTAQSQRPVSEASQLLSGAAATEAQRQAQLEAETETRAREQKRRMDLFAVSKDMLNELAEHLKQRFSQSVFNLTIATKVTALVLSLGHVRLQLETVPRFIGADGFKGSRWDVIAGSSIKLTATAQPFGKYSASLWYAKLPNNTEYRWYQVAQDHHVFVNRPATEANLAHQGSVNPVVPVHQAMPIDAENVDAFAEEWMKRFARAYNGNL
jgi:serine/threonine protein kinase